MSREDLGPNENASRGVMDDSWDGRNLGVLLEGHKEVEQIDFHDSICETEVERMTVSSWWLLRRLREIVA